MPSETLEISAASIIPCQSSIHSRQRGTFEILSCLCERRSRTSSWSNSHRDEPSAARTISRKAFKFER
eukprot:scaffold572300_cov20-Prasinocladus_malaysianus.AAC.1